MYILGRTDRYPDGLRDGWKEGKNMSTIYISVKNSSKPAISLGT